MNRRSVTLLEAVEQAPTLARLSHMAAESGKRLAIVRPLLPTALAALVRPGAPDDEAWCLLVPHNAAAAKIRQLVPAMLAQLQAEGIPVTAIRIKVVRTDA